MFAKFKRKILWNLYLQLNKRGYNVVKTEHFAFPDQQKFFHSKSPSTIFDVGANGGDITQKYLELFPQSQIFGFEPVPHLIKQFSQRFAAYSNIHPFQLALSDIAGESTFFVNKGVDTSSLLPSRNLDEMPSSYEQVYGISDKITVQTQTIDTFCSQNNIQGIDILKMDVQGAELKVLEGAKEMLSKRAIKLIYTELFFIPTYEQQPLFYEVSNFLFKHNFRFFNFYNVGFNGTTGRILQADCIFVEEDFFKQHSFAIKLR